MDNPFSNYVMANPVGVMIVIIVSGIFAWLWCFLGFHIFYRRVLVLSIPLILSYYAYWIPIENSGSTDPEYLGYAFILIPFMAYLGYASSGIAIWIHRIVFSKRNIPVDK
ncbi:hypothetical protein LLG95_11765 [bacterium]|nr:hypothetical protein [bacterium]